MTWDLTKGVPYKHQEQIVSEYGSREFFGLFAEQGTGKTFTLLAVAEKLRREQGCQGVLILAPNGVHANWIMKEIPEHCITEPRITGLWSSTGGVRVRRKLNQALTAPHEQFVFVSFNIEAVRSTEGYMAMLAFLKSRKVLMVVDESTVIKSHRAQQTKAALKLAPWACWRWILTGTPIEQSPLDLYTQCSFLHPEATGHRTFTSFKAEYAIEQEMVYGPRRFRKVIGFRNLEQLRAVLGRFTLRVTKEECLDLPPKTYVTEVVEMTGEQKRLYSAMKETFLMRLNGGVYSTAQNALTAMLRLQQLLSGFVSLDDGTIRVVENNRINQLLALVDRHKDKKIVIWCAFREDVKAIFHALNKNSDWYEPGAYPLTYFGEDDSESRVENVDRFQKDHKSKWLICTSAAARGITLTASCLAIYYSRNFKLGDRLQSEDRIHRIGQEKKTTFIDLVVPNTVDDRTLQRLKDKKQLADAVIDFNDIRALVEDAEDDIPM